MNCVMLLIVKLENGSIKLSLGARLQRHSELVRVVRSVNTSE